jgi:hypothetical protein
VKPPAERTLIVLTDDRDGMRRLARIDGFVQSLLPLAVGLNRVLDLLLDLHC